ncbi:hypothetical protein OBK08_08310 [Empedobacter falsenii]
MKVRGYKFGHPVFGYFDYFDFAPFFKPNLDTKANELIIGIEEIDLGNNTTLKGVIETKKAHLIVEVFCTYTMFRKCFVFQNNDEQFAISLDMIKHKVDCFFFIVASEDLPNYVNPAVKDEMTNESFYVEKGELLAFLGDYKFELDLKGTTIDSFIKIRPKEVATGQTNYIFVQDAIIIELNEKDFDQLKQISVNPDFQQILITSMLQPALIHACYKLAEEGFEEKVWYRTLMLRWEMFKSSEEVPTSNDIPEFVEHLLQDPMKRLLDTLNQLNHQTNSDEEELWDN